jgi:hypothetical protein
MAIPSQMTADDQPAMKPRSDTSRRILARRSIIRILGRRPYSFWTKIGSSQFFAAAGAIISSIRFVGYGVPRICCGIFRVSSAPLGQVLAVMGKE